MINPQEIVTTVLLDSMSKEDLIAMYRVVSEQKESVVEEVTVENSEDKEEPSFIDKGKDLIDRAEVFIKDEENRAVVAGVAAIGTAVLGVAAWFGLSD